MSDRGWQFWIDRGGTFTDVVARDPDGTLLSLKLLSENPEHYADAAVAGIRRLLRLDANASIPARAVDAVKMGTTVATNALLERKGEPLLLVTTAGFADALRIGYQARPRLFALNIRLPGMLYARVLEVDERIAANGEVVRALNLEQARAGLLSAYAAGLRSVAICLLHAYRFHAHERALAELARDIGFTQVSASHQTSPLMKLVSRGDTTVVDAYLSPILRRYVDHVAAELGDVRLLFMQSNGGLTDARLFQGKDAILSGPAGGVVGMVRTAAAAGYHQVIGFDMGGTSTDVSHYAGEFERAFETQVAGVRLRAPMMLIHTVAAGGGSILQYDGARFRVGPDSAGANPGPACYRRGGPLTVTDCNLMLGRLIPECFPSVFGPDADQPLDVDATRRGFAELAARVGRSEGRIMDAETVAEGFLRIAVQNMANAIKQVSVQRGYDVSGYLLNCFGGAGGQHACRVADALGIRKVLLHPYAGVLSAYGMGLADLRLLRQQAVEAVLDAPTLRSLRARLHDLAADGRREMAEQGVERERISDLRRLLLRYQGSDTALQVDYGPYETVRRAFSDAHRQRFGFDTPDKTIIVEALNVEVIGQGDIIESKLEPEAAPPGDRRSRPRRHCAAVFDGERRQVPVYERQGLVPGAPVDGPAIIIEANSTTVVEPGWQAGVDRRDHLMLERVEALPRQVAVGTDVDPIMLEIFNNLFMSIAEQMGAVLENTAYSVNIKERLDFSCAVFDQDGELVANAPHMPVHLGSMSESIRTVIRENAGRMHEGDVFMLNAPYNGGTHLPDVTVIKPVFDQAGERVLFYVAARGHHADLGGTTPGSMPPDSRSVEEEGVLFDNVRIVDRGQFQEQLILDLLAAGPYPARNPVQNLADLRAQIAACEKGVLELRRMIAQFGLDVVQAYMKHVQDNAEESVRRVLDVLSDGRCTCELDDGSRVQVAVSVDRKARRARIDFSGTSAQHPGNFNAPTAVCKAAVLYVFRCLVDDEIPLNAGCLKPLDIHIPDGSMLNPVPPAAVVAGNVETSQVIVDALFGALGAVAGAQGTMNNLTFGNDRYQYYETLCGGSGAGPDFDGTDAVHTHMTNSRLTDPEVLEWRYPVRVESFAIRRDSGGAGRHRGGDGVVRRLRFLEPMTAAILANRRKVPPFGLAGGKPGATGRNYVIRNDGRIEQLAATGRRDLDAGEQFVIETPGGGGYGRDDSEEGKE